MAGHEKGRWCHGLNCFASMRRIGITEPALLGQFQLLLAWCGFFNRLWRRRKSELF
jgi:hypothetical protein